MNISGHSRVDAGDLLTMLGVPVTEGEAFGGTVHLGVWMVKSLLDSSMLKWSQKEVDQCLQWIHDSADNDEAKRVAEEIIKQVTK